MKLMVARPKIVRCAIKCGIAKYETIFFHFHVSSCYSHETPIFLAKLGPSLIFDTAVRFDGTIKNSTEFLFIIVLAVIVDL